MNELDISETIRYDPTCPLCRITTDKDFKIICYYSDELMIIVDCSSCNVPMAVLQEHRILITKEEEKKIRDKLDELFGNENRTFRGPRKFQEHYHLHYIKGEK